MPVQVATNIRQVIKSNLPILYVLALLVGMLAVTTGMLYLTGDWWRTTVTAIITLLKGLAWYPKVSNLWQERLPHHQ